MVAAAAVLTAQMDITQEEMFWVNRIMMWQFKVSCNQIGLCQGQKGPAIRVPPKFNNVFNNMWICWDFEKNQANHIVVGFRAGSVIQG